jgi:single-stranded-DNA-specific exonuclease
MLGSMIDRSSAGLADVRSVSELRPRHRWQIPDPIRVPAALRDSGRAHGLGLAAVAVLARRGVTTPDALEAFLAPPVAGLHDPRRLPDADILVRRIGRARDAGERVMVFGDFDADGLTGLAILVGALRHLGISAVPYVPSRLEEGHGLSLAAVDTAVAEGCTVIVTVDTGSSSVAEVAAARTRGIDVLITDHHHVPEVAPASTALVNPHRPGSTYPDRGLSGAGVAFTVARLLLGELEAAEADALAFADLATIGTVSDVAPILGENRSIARLGLERIRGGPRPGIGALLARARVAAADVDLETIGFVIAPRLNAAGRVGEAIDAAHLLLATTSEEADELAGHLEVANSTRRDQMRQAVAEARTALGLAPTGQAPGQELLFTDPAVSGPDGPLPPAHDPTARLGPAAIVRGPWPVGIVGLVAGRIADETGLPTIVGAELGDQIRASCRGDGRLHLARTLDACADLLTRHGGHAAAAGFELPAERWPAFVERFTAAAAVDAPEDPRPPLRVDLALPAAFVDYGLYRDLARLAPCGAGNPEPLVAVLGLTVTRVREATGGHTQLVLKRDLDVLDGIAFGRSDLSATVREGDRVDVVARLVSRVFGGNETLQLEVRDVALSGSHPRAAEVLARLASRAAPAVEAGALATGDAA